MPKIVRLTCPNCREILEVNLLRGEIERHWPKGTTPGAADLMAKAQETIQKAAQDPDMDGLLRKLEDREKKTDELFSRAVEKARQQPVQKPPDEGAPA